MEVCKNTAVGLITAGGRWGSCEPADRGLQTASRGGHCWQETHLLSNPEHKQIMGRITLGGCYSAKELALVSQKSPLVLCSWHLSCTAVKVSFRAEVFLCQLSAGCARTWLSCLYSKSKPDLWGGVQRTVIV